MTDNGWTQFIHERPAEDDVFDVWVPFIRARDGYKSGTRLTNCWYAGDDIVQSRFNWDGSHQENIIVRGATHWRLVPEGPVN